MRVKRGRSLLKMLVANAWKSLTCLVEISSSTSNIRENCISHRAEVDFVVPVHALKLVGIVLYPRSTRSIRQEWAFVLESYVTPASKSGTARSRKAAG